MDGDARIRFYTDEQVPAAVSDGLRRRGIDVATAQERGMLGAPDEDQLALATSERRTLLTQDTDFLRLHVHARGHTGIVYASQRLGIGTIVQALTLMYQAMLPEELHDHVEYL